MALSKKLKLRNSIILANGITPALFTEYWFIKNEIFRDGDIQQNSRFSPEIVHIHAIDNFQIIVLPNQIQFIWDVNQIENGVLSEAIIKKLPEFQFVASGINYIWFVKDSELDIATLSSKLFANERTPIYNSFKSSDAMFGMYMSKDFSTCRLKLDIKPVKNTDYGLLEKEEAIALSFNFHKDFDSYSDSKNDLISFFQNTASLEKEALSIINLLV